MKTNRLQRTVLLHDYLNQQGGAEKVLESFLQLYPSAEIYTLLRNKRLFPNLRVKTSFVQYFPLKKKYKFYMPFFPLAVKSFRLPPNSLLLSSSYAFIKNISKPKNSLHICYCHTPMRYAWDLKETYLQKENVFLRPFIKLSLSYLSYWDKKQSNQVDFFIANSQHVAKRIEKFYQRDAIVIYPPIDTVFFKPSQKRKNDYYLVVSRLVEYKKVDLVINAFKKLSQKLIIAGSGRDEKQLKKLARGYANIAFVGRISQKKLRELYQHAKALVFPQVEDFGITSVEVQSCGTPVIAFSQGGALETVLEGKTGHFFPKQTPESLIKAVKMFETMHFKPKDCRKNALKFDKKIFKKNIKQYITKKYEEHKNAQ